MTNEERWEKSFYATLKTASGRNLDFANPTQTSSETGGGGKYGVGGGGGATKYEGYESVYSEYLIASDHNDATKLYFRRDAKDIGFSIHTFDGQRITVSNRGYVYKTETPEYARVFRFFDAKSGEEINPALMSGNEYRVIIKSSDQKEVLDTYQWNKVGQYSWSYLSTFTDIKEHSAQFTLSVVSRGGKGPID